MKKDTLASRLTERITLELPEETSDEMGGFTTAWEEFATVWAEIASLSTNSFDGENFTDMQLQSRSMYRFTIRDMEGISTAMRIRYDDQLFNIRALRYPDAGRAALEILAEEGAPV